ncbi:hypothetical protein ABZ832_13685 [Streptantibioticus parmotrematis]|uniref:hypothetical protein n=1 Tax=Streptantibioticus parmotrematis TaxID=2873249 RepID=UPI0033C740ED
MRRGLVHAGAWTLATGAAIALSWFGVHTVLAGTVYDPPRALPISGGLPSVGVYGSLAPAPPTTGPRESASAGPSSSATPSPSASITPERPPGRAGSTASGGATTGDVHSYEVTGGRVALVLGSSSATLVSATPDSGWSTKVWKEPGWIRVDFTSGVHTSSIFCTWNGHPPTVQTYAS